MAKPMMNFNYITNASVPIINADIILKLTLYLLKVATT